MTSLFDFVISISDIEDCTFPQKVLKSVRCIVFEEAGELVQHLCVNQDRNNHFPELRAKNQQMRMKRIEEEEKTF